MKYVVCEGNNDRIFLSLIIEKTFSKRPLTIREMKKAQATFNPPEYRYLRKSYDLFIYEDNGRPTIYKKVVPRLMIDSWKRLRERIEFFVIIDEDFQDRTDLIVQILSSLKQRMNNTKHRIQTNIRDERLEIIHTSDNTFHTIVHLFLIPKSLEQQIVDMAFINYRKEFTKEGLTLSIHTDVHTKLKRIVNVLGFESLCHLIAHVLEKEWFVQEQWFKNLTEQLKEFLTN